MFAAAMTLVFSRAGAADVPANWIEVVAGNMFTVKAPPGTTFERTRTGDAFAGTFHVNEFYEEMRASFHQAAAGQIPEHPPFELYCHSLTDESILGPELRDAGYQTLTAGSGHG